MNDTIISHRILILKEESKTSDLLKILILNFRETIL